jgi:hypothetical protein
MLDALSHVHQVGSRKLMGYNSIIWESLRRLGIFGLPHVVLLQIADWEKMGVCGSHDQDSCALLSWAVEGPASENAKLVRQYQAHVAFRRLAALSRFRFLH